MFDMEKFIVCIQEKPALWEKQNSEYSDRNCRERAWAEIGEIMYNNWLALGFSQRDEKVKEMKNKWRHARDNYLKYINLEKSGKSPLKRKKYIYADVLSFLIGSLENRKPKHNNTTSVTKEEPDEKDWVNLPETEEEYAYEDTLPVSPNSIEPGVSHQFQYQYSVPPAEYRTHSQPISTFQTEVLKILQSTRMEEEDADRSFLISILPDYRKLNDEEKLDFRLMTLQFFKSVQQKSK